MVGQWIRSLELFVVLAWYIWNHRNCLRLNEKGLATYIIFQLAKTYFSDFQLKLLKTIVKSSLGNIKWRPLLSAMYKTNYDGARRAAKFIVELGISFFESQGDSEVVCEALRTTDWGHPSIGQIVKDSLSIVGSLITFSFSHTR